MFELTLDAAFERSEREHKLVLVIVVSGAPSWLDAAVTECIRRDAIAVRVDFEGQPEIVRGLDVYLPMVLAFWDRNEIDRIREPETSGKMLAWLEQIRGCTTQLAVWHARVATNPTDCDARQRLARLLEEEGRVAEAVVHWVWLWQHILEHRPSEDGRRPGWLMGQLRIHLADHPAARSEFAKLRDQLTPPPTGTPDRVALRDWATLNAVLGEDAATLRWFDEIYSKLIDKTAIVEDVDRALVRPLMEYGRWADAGKLMVDPLARIQKLIFRPGAREVDPALEKAVDAVLDAETEARMKKMGSLGRCMFAGMFVRALVAAGRREDARAVGDYALGVDDSQEMLDTLIAEGLAPTN